MFNTILVMLALDDRDTTLLKAIIANASQFEISRLVLAHVHPRDPFPTGLMPTVSVERPEALDDALNFMRNALPDIDVIGLHGAGQPQRELTKLIAQERCDLVAFGRFKSDNNQSAWGPTGRKQLRVATCSTLVIPQGSELSLKHAMAGLDFSRSSTNALVVACQLFENVTAVYGYNDSQHTSVPRIEAHSSVEAHPDSPQTQTNFRVELAAKALVHFEHHVIPRITNGHLPTLELAAGEETSHVLIERAGSATIVVGSRGLSGFSAGILGSVAERVAGRSNSPVLVVRDSSEQDLLMERLFV